MDFDINLEMADHHSAGDRNVIKDMLFKGFICGLIYAALIIFFKGGFDLCTEHSVNFFSKQNFIIICSVVPGITAISGLLGLLTRHWDKKNPPGQNNPWRKIFNIMPKILFVLSHLENNPIKITHHHQNESAPAAIVNYGTMQEVRGYGQEHGTSMTAPVVSPEVNYSFAVPIDEPQIIEDKPEASVPSRVISFIRKLLPSRQENPQSTGHPICHV